MATDVFNLLKNPAVDGALQIQIPGTAGQLHPHREFLDRTKCVGDEGSYGFDGVFRGRRVLQELPDHAQVVEDGVLQIPDYVALRMRAAEKGIADERAHPVCNGCGD